MASSSPPDGSWLDNPKMQKNILKFLISKLSPADAEELDRQLTGESTATAMDARLDGSPDLKRDFLDYHPRDRKVLRNALRGVGGRMTMDEDPDDRKSFLERFPNLNRLKG